VLARATCVVSSGRRDSRARWTHFIGQARRSDNYCKFVHNAHTPVQISVIVRHVILSLLTDVDLGYRC